MKKWMTVALFLVVSVFTARAVHAAEAETAAPVTPVTAEDVGMTDSGKDVFVTLTRTAYSGQALPFNTQTVRPATFETYDAQNAGDAISRMTSVSIAPQWGLGSTRLAGIRGATSNQTMVLVDGRPVGGVGLSGSQDLAEIPTEQIDHIEVVRGGVSALYGPNAIGGVINVITKRATYEGKPVSNIGYEAGSYDRQAYRLNFGSRWKNLDYFFFGNQQMQSGFRDNSDARTHNIGGNVGFSMGAGGKLLFDMANYHANAGVPGQLFPDIPTNQYDNSVEKAAGTPDARQITDTTYMRASYILPLPMNSLMSLRAFGSEREVKFAIPSFFVDTDRFENSKGVDAQVNMPFGLMAGGSFLHDRLDSEDFITPANNYIAHVENWGIFLQEDFHWKSLALIPSVRYDDHSVAGHSTNPRIQVIEDATDWLRLSGSAARSFRAPTIDDLYTPFTDFGGGFSYVGNPNLRPEKAWTYDAGFELHNSSTSFRAGYFRANVQDQIQTTADFASTTVNVGEARRQGAEIQLGHVMNTYYKDSWNYTYLENMGKPLGFTEFVPLRLSPRHTVNYLSTITPVKNVALDNSVRYVGDRFEGNNETGTKLGDYVIWGLRVSYQLRQLKAYIGVENLTDKRYEERGGYPLPGRTYYGGVTLKLWD